MASMGVWVQRARRFQFKVMIQTVCCHLPLTDLPLLLTLKVFLKSLEVCPGIAVAQNAYLWIEWTMFQPWSRSLCCVSVTLTAPLVQSYGILSKLWNFICSFCRVLEVCTGATGTHYLERYLTPNLLALLLIFMFYIIISARANYMHKLILYVKLNIDTDNKILFVF